MYLWVYLQYTSKSVVSFTKKGYSLYKQGCHWFLKMKFQEISRRYPGDFIFFQEKKFIRNASKLIGFIVFSCRLFVALTISWEIDLIYSHFNCFWTNTWGNWIVNSKLTSFISVPRFNITFCHIKTESKL